LGKPHHQNGAADRNGHRRHRSTPDERRHHGGLTLTEEGFPAAAPDAVKPSAVVTVADESRARFPWLPARVIAGSVWRGPRHERVRVDEAGRALPWRCGQIADPTPRPG
jgi:hypothetical protein